MTSGFKLWNTLEPSKVMSRCAYQYVTVLSCQPVSKALIDGQWELLSGALTAAAADEHLSFVRWQQPDWFAESQNIIALLLRCWLFL